MTEKLSLEEITKLSQGVNEWNYEDFTEPGYVSHRAFFGKVDGLEGVTVRVEYFGGQGSPEKFGIRVLSGDLLLTDKKYQKFSQRDFPGAAQVYNAVRKIYTTTETQKVSAELGKIRQFLEH